MPIDFICPHCGKRTLVDDQYRGSTGSCVDCGKPITISDFSSTPGDIKGAPTRTSGGAGTAIGCLVVIVGVVMLGAILLPALQSGHGHNYSFQCGNNLKNISLGLQNYHDTYKCFPAGAMHAGIRGKSPKLGPSWYFAPLPYMEQRDVHDRIMELQTSDAPGDGTFNAANVNAALPEVNLNLRVPDYMRCPSSPLPEIEHSTNSILLPSYVGISGGCDIDSANHTLYPNPRWGRPITARVYTNLHSVPIGTDGVLTSSGMLPPNQCVDVALCSDGTSNTMIVGEQSAWLRDADSAVSTKFRGDAGWNGVNTDRAGGWLSGTAEVRSVAELQAAGERWELPLFNITTVRYRPDLKKIIGSNGPPGCGELPNENHNNPLQSPHPGGMLVALVDGSVQFVSETTDLGVLLRLAIRDDGQAVKLD